MKKIVYVIKILLSFVITFSLFMEWIWYVLTFSNIPTVFTTQMAQDFKIIICLFCVTLFALLLEFFINKKNKIRGSYLVILAGILLLLLWSIRYSTGFNYNSREQIINIYDKRIVTFGLFISILCIVTQLYQTIKARKHRERQG